MKKLITLLVLIPTLCFGQWNQLGSDIDGLVANEQSGTSISLNSSGTILAVSAPRAMDNGVMKGKVRVFEWNGSSWIQKGTDIIGSSLGDAFGNSVTISANGNVIIIGAPGSLSPDYLSATGPTGYARIFEWNGSDWIQKGTDILGAVPNDIAGNTVTVNTDGTIIGISFPGFDGVNGANSGAIRIYEWNGTGWIQKGSDILGPTANTYLGVHALNATGNIIAIGSAGDNTGGSNAGSVKVFEFNGSSWIQKGTTVLGNNSVLQGHGSTLAIDDTGTNFITGGYSFTNGALGYAKAYTWNGTSWIPNGATLPGTTGSDFFGTAVDISQDGSIIAASSLTVLNGYVRVFKFVGSSWIQQGADILGEASGDQFGRSLSLSANGSILAAGTPYNDGNGTSAGHVRVFENSIILNIDDLIDQVNINVFPNPTSNYIQVESKQNIQSYKMVSINGKLIQGKNDINKNSLTINIENIEIGIYILQLVSGEKTKSIKLIKK